ESLCPGPGARDSCRRATIPSLRSPAEARRELYAAPNLTHRCRFSCHVTLMFREQFANHKRKATARVLDAIGNTLAINLPQEVTPYTNLPAVDPGARGGIRTPTVAR